MPRHRIRLAFSPETFEELVHQPNPMVSVSDNTMKMIWKAFSDT